MIIKGIVIVSPLFCLNSSTSLLSQSDKKSCYISVSRYSKSMVTRGYYLNALGIRYYKKWRIKNKFSRLLLIKLQ